MHTVDPESANLADFSFDFDAYFARAEQRSLTQEEEDEYSARVIGLFCREVFLRKAPPSWVLQHMADRLADVLDGVAWNDALPLPWLPATPLRSRKSQRDMSIFCEIANALSADPKAKVTRLIEEAADRHCVSYETARSAWYSHRHYLQASDVSKAGA